MLAAAGVIAAFTLDTQVGMNAIRLPALFAAPILVATCRLRPRLLAPIVVLTVCVVPPLNPGDVTAIGDPSTHASYYDEVVSELDRLPLTGRVEIPPTQQRWESVYVAERFPLARGWMTQLDAGYDPLFFDDEIRAAPYLRWLHDNAVQYVAVPDAQPAQAGESEIALIDSGLPYLRRLWEGEHWTVYAVRRPTSTVSGADLVSQDPVSVTFHADAPGTVVARIRWSRWLTLAGPAACLKSDGDWTAIVVRQPGVYRLDSAFDPDQGHRTCATR
jgi:hypothetical protein